MKTADEQIDLLKKAAQYIQQTTSLGVDVSMSSFCYMNAQEVTPGYMKLKNIQFRKKINFRYLFVILKHLLSISTLHNYRIINKKNFEGKEFYEKLLISWASKNDFEEDGSFKDPKFRIHSKNHKNILWFLIYKDDSIPKKIASNIIVFSQDKKKIKYNFYYLIKIFSKSIWKNKKSLFKILHELSLQSHFAKILSEIIKKMIVANNFKSIIMPYEAQPFQNKVFLEVKKINKEIRTIGYTAVTQPFPSMNIFKLGAPDILFVHGLSEIKHLQNNLLWPAERLKLIPSLKYKKKDKVFLNNKIFIPYSIMKKKILIEEFKNLLLRQKNLSLKNFILQNHPYKYNSLSHKKFVKNLDNIIKNNKNKFSENAKTNLSIFFGETYAIVEALERGIQVAHICGDPVFESYSERLWDGIKVSQFSENTFLYTLKKPGQCINFEEFGEEDTFTKYFN